MSHTLDGGEGKTIVLLNVAGDLGAVGTCGVPWLPSGFHFPVKVLDPSPGAIWWDSGISVT